MVKQNHFYEWADGGNVISDDVPSPVVFGSVTGQQITAMPTKDSWQGLSRNEVKEMMRPLRERLAREADWR